MNDICRTPHYPFPKQQILDSSKLKEFADNNFKSDENGTKFFKQVENTVGKGEIAHYEQFLLFPHCFQKICTADMQKPGLVLERVNCLLDTPILGTSNSAANKAMMSKILTNGEIFFQLSRKHCGKRRNCSLRAISSVPNMFSKANYC